MMARTKFYPWTEFETLFKMLLSPLSTTQLTRIAREGD